MSRKELLENLSTTLLWEVISAKVEEVNQLPVMLKGIAYIEDKDEIISKITRCEVLDSEPFDVKDFSVDGNRIKIHFEMSFVLTAWENKEERWRITSTAAGTCFVPDIEIFHWEDIKFEDMNRMELLERKNLVEISELKYVETECDDVSAITW